MSPDPQTTTTSVEVPAKKSLWARIWAYQPAKEFLLMLAAAVGLQLGLGLNELYGAIDTAESWEDLLTSTRSWAGVFSFVLVTTAIKQSIAWAVARLAGSRL